MSSQKKKNNEEAAFKTSPFRSLKGLKTNAPIAKPAPPLIKAPEEREDDAELFRRAMHGARPVHDQENDNLLSSKAPAANKPKPTDDAEPGAELFLRAMQSLGTGPVRPPMEENDDIGAAEKRSASSRMRQLKKGTIRISGELDLHGFLRDEALRRLEHFIAAASVRGQLAVLVITGKGINSSAGPVLQSAVGDWLRAHSGGMVAEFHPAPRDKGGSGAFVVFLKKK